MDDRAKAVVGYIKALSDAEFDWDGPECWYEYMFSEKQIGAIYLAAKELRKQFSEELFEYEIVDDVAFIHNYLKES